MTDEEEEFPKYSTRRCFFLPLRRLLGVRSEGVFQNDVMALTTDGLDGYRLEMSSSEDDVELAPDPEELDGGRCWGAL